MENADPDNIEPGKATSWGSQETRFRASGTSLEMFHRPNPGFGLNRAEEVLLVVQVGTNVGAEQTKEGSDGEGFITVSYDFKIDTVVVVDEGEEGDGGVDRDHEQNANDVLLLVRFEVMGGMHEDQKEGDGEGNDAEDGGYPEAEFVKGVAVPYWVFIDGHVLQSGVTDWPPHFDCGVNVYSLTGTRFREREMYVCAIRELFA